MPDLEELIRTALDRQAQRPDPDSIVERVARRKRQVRLARRVQSATLAVVVVAGIGAGGYALARAFGVGEHLATAVSPTIPGPTVGPSATRGIAFCGDVGGSLALVSQEGAAGTTRTLWRFTTAAACRSFGYPRIDFHGPSGWQSPSPLHSGYQDITGGPRQVPLQAGQSLFFITYWNDVGGPCVSFDRVRVTLPSSASG